MRTRISRADVDVIDQTCSYIVEKIATDEAFTSLRKVHKFHLLKHFAEDIRRFGPLGIIDPFKFFLYHFVLL